MKFVNFRVIIILIIGYIVFNYLKPFQWNIGIYSILFFLFFYNFIQLLYWIIITRKGIYTLGRIHEELDEVKEEKKEDNVKIEFISPIDKMKYSIKTKSQYLKDDSNYFSKENIRIWVNPKNPFKSLIVFELNSARLLSLISLFFFSIIFLVLIIFSF
jgi:hypothetical protein